MGHILVVEDDEDLARSLCALIGRENHSVTSTHSLHGARRLLALQSPDLLLLDLHLPDGSGFDLLADDGGLLADTEVILMTGQASVETSVQALRMGAADYLVKPVNPAHLRGLLSRLIRPSRLREELARITDQWRDTGRFGDLVGTSEPMQRVYRQISRVASTAVTVFIHGKSGTGKELVARAVHDLSRRRDMPFLAVNCGALSPHLVESEIFGHEKGSFTGADRQHQGFFERAHGGTLFLDEVTEMAPELQVKLLRVLETSAFMRVGSTQLQQTDVRVIAATNRDALEAVARGRLREDLLYRLNVFPIALPPLRDRGNDVQLIARSLLAEMSASEGQDKHFTPDALARLLEHAWPGNVRELRNVVQRVWVMTPGNVVDEEWLPVATAPRPEALPRQVPPPANAWEAEAPPPLAPDAPRDAADAPDAMAVANGRLCIPLGTRLSDIERQVILATFAHCERHKERTAATLGISMKTLYNRLKDYGA